jgi:hypothetical protein
LGAAAGGHESFELAADELFLALVELDLGLRLRCLVRRGDEADPLVWGAVLVSGPHTTRSV